MAKLQKKAGRGAAKRRKASGKPASASTPEQSPAGDAAQSEDIQSAAESAEEAVSAAVQGATNIDEDQLHPAERAVYLAVHGSPQPKVKQ